MAGRLSGLKDWLGKHKVVGYGGAGVALFAAYEVYARSKSSTATAAPLSTAPGVDSGSQLVNPGAEQVTLTSPTNPNASTGSTPRHQKTTQVTPVVAPVAAPAAPAAPKTFGQGIIDTINGPMVWLGVTGAGGSTASTYQVGGGAPVYFGNAQSNAIGGTTQAGIDVYTPVADEDLVSSNPG